MGTRTVTRGALASLPWFLVAAGFASSFARSATPRSLVDALGMIGAVWTLGLILTAVAAGMLELLQDPLRPRMARLRFGIAVHIAGAVALTGYAVGVIFGPTTPLITIGLSLGMAAVHLVRWRRIVTQDIPMADLIASQRETV